MKRPTFLEGAAVALGASLASSILFSALSPFIPGPDLLKLLIAALGLAYTLYLFKRSPERLGQLVTLAGWALSTLTIWLLNPPLMPYLLLHIGLIWLIRSLYFYSSLFASLADLGLGGLGLAAALWAAVNSGSLLLSIWCFFLVQALFSAIPPKLKKRPAPATAADATADRFQQAEQAAETALRRLTPIR